MARIIVCALAIAMFALPAMAADYSLGLRWNHYQLTGGGDFWDEYVTDKEIRESLWSGSEWTERDTLVTAAQSEDFSNFNPIPAVRFGARFESFELITDLEYYQSAEVRISEYTLVPFKKNAPYAFDYEEEATLSLITLKETFHYLIPYKKSLMYVGGGLGLYQYELKDDFVFTLWELIGGDYSINTREKYDLTDDGLGFGIHAVAGYEHNLNDTWHPFLEISYEYAMATWEPDDLSNANATYGYLPTRDEPFRDPQTDDVYGYLKGNLQDSYDIMFSGIKVSAGVNFFL
ncbi:hypothetical protein JW905_12925 [bacterium]|nr:hypothetical protein [candidate division CSSED10-310 bacterium]